MLLNKAVAFGTLADHHSSVLRYIKMKNLLLILSHLEVIEAEKVFLFENYMLCEFQYCVLFVLMCSDKHF